MRVVVLVTLAAWLAGGTESTLAATRAPPDFDRALTWIRAERNVPEAIAMLDGLARVGDTRACLLLGTIFLDGKLVPQDKPLGFAFLRMGVDAKGGYFDKSATRRIDELVLKYSATMTGRELVQSDRLLGNLKTDADRQTLEAIREQLTFYTPTPAITARPGIRFADEPVSISLSPPEPKNPYYKLGCAAASLNGCPVAATMNDTPRCTGTIWHADQPAVTVGPEVNLGTPDYPVDMRRNGVTGTVTIIAHVDSSGLICSALVVGMPPGGKPLAYAAANSVVRWKVQPACKHGVPTESLMLLGVGFYLTD